MNTFKILGFSVMIGVYVTITNKLCYELGRIQGQSEAYSEVTEKLTEVVDEANRRFPSIVNEEIEKSKERVNTELN